MGEEGKRELLQNVLTFISMYVCVDRRLQKYFSAGFNIGRVA